METKNQRLSVILPAYNEEQMLPKAARTVGRILAEHGIDYELIFVDDGSSDRTWEMIGEAAAGNGNIHGIRFSRNFGKEAAIFAGLAMAKGGCAAVMDCDLQHPPETLLEMYALWQQGYEIVEGIKRTRGKESAVHAFCAGFLNKLRDVFRPFFCVLSLCDCRHCFSPFVFCLV